MRICLYTMHSPASLGPMAALTELNKRRYCERHRYDYHWEEFRHQMFPGFERLPALMRLLKSDSYDWIFWLGCDALITNQGVKLESLLDPAFGIVMATDAFQVQMDSFLIQKSHNGLKMIESVWERRQNPIGPYYEQSTLDALRQTPEFTGTVKLLPQRAMNSYRYALYRDLGGRYLQGLDCLGNGGEWQPGDFVFHVPGRPFEIKMAALQKIKNEAGL